MALPNPEHDFGRAVASLRDKAGLTQLELALRSHRRIRGALHTEANAVGVRDVAQTSLEQCGGFRAVTTPLRIERYPHGEPISFLGFAKKYGLTMAVYEREVGQTGPSGERLKRYFAYFQSVEEMIDGMLGGPAGQGDTEEEAIADYRDKLRGKRVAIRAYRKERVNVTLPNEWLPEPEDYP